MRDRRETPATTDQTTGTRIDRRDLIKGAAALGVSGAALGGALSLRPGMAIAAQDAAAGAGLLTVSQDQQQVWIKNFNPLLPEGDSRWPTHAGIHEPMIIYNTIKGEIVPWLATEYAFNADNTELTFTIRDGVSWSDGTPFSAKDVLFTFNLLIENTALPGTGGVRGVLESVSSVDMPTENTVRFVFSKVYTPGLYDLGHQMIVPEHIWKEVADPVTFTNETPVGTGPFTEIGTFQDNYWELHKNPNYWQEGKPVFEGIRFPAYPNNDAANLATLNGENDWAGNFIPDVEAAYVAKDPENHHYWFPSTGATVHLYANTTRAPFDDPNVRKALSMALDRAQIVEIAMYDYTHPADTTGLSDAFTDWKSDAATGAGWAEQDLEAANELLDAAGLTLDGDVRKLPDGTEMVYDINVVSGWSDWVQSCQIMAQNLEDIGIKAEVKTYDFTAWFERVQTGDFDLSIGWSTGGATPFNFFRGMLSGQTALEVGEAANENWHRYVSEEGDSLLADFAATSDVEEQKRIAEELQVIYAEQAPAIPLFPGPQWGEFNTTRFTGFPSEENPYALLSTYAYPERLLVMTTIEPVE